MKFLTYIFLDGENVWFPHTKHRQSTAISFQPIPITLMREVMYVCYGMRLLDNLNFQSDEFSQSQSSVGQQ